MAKKLVQITYVVSDAALLKSEKALKDNEAAAKRADQQINKFGKDAEKAGNNASKSFLNLGTVWKSLIAIGITTFMANLARRTFELGVQQEQLNIAFSTFLGSGERAKKLLQELTKFAIVTPFTPDQVNNAAKALLAFGVQGEQIIPTLKMLGDVSAGTGKDLTEMAIIFGQIRSTGRLMGQDLLQLINAGFNPLQVISEKTGKSVKALKEEMEKGLISFDMVSDAFKTATSEGGLFFNLMEKQSQSVGGLLSTVSGNIDELLKNIFTATSGPIKEFTQQLVELSEGLLAASKSAETWADEKKAMEVESLVSQFKAFASAFNDLNRAQDVNNQLLDQELVRLRKQKEEMETGVIPVNEELYNQILERISQIDRERVAVREYIAEVDKAKEAEKNKKNAAAAEEHAKALAKLRKEYHQNALEIMRRPPQEEGEPPGFGVDNLFGGFLSPEQRRMLEDDTKTTLQNIEDANQRSLDNQVNQELLATQRKDAIRQQSFNLAINLLSQLGQALIKEGESEIDAVNDKYDELEEKAKQDEETRLAIAGDSAKAREAVRKDSDRREKELDKQKERDLDEARKRQAKKEQEIAIKRMIVENALNAVKALGTPPVPNFAAAGLALAYGAGSVIIAKTVGFKDGVIDLQGPGTGTSDSIPARLSRGESVITAEATQRSRSLLEAIQEKRIDDRVLRKLAVNGGSTINNFDDTRMVKELQQMNGTDYYERGHRMIKKVRKGESLTEHVHTKYHG